MCMLHNLVSNYVTISTKHFSMETHTTRPTRCFDSSGKLHTHFLVGEIGISLIVVSVTNDIEGGKISPPQIRNNSTFSKPLHNNTKFSTLMKTVNGVIILVTIVNLFLSSLTLHSILCNFSTAL